MRASSEKVASGQLIIRTKIHPILIADPNAKFLEGMWADPQAQNVPPMVAQSAKEAQQVLAQYEARRNLHISVFRDRRNRR